MRSIIKYLNIAVVAGVVLVATSCDKDYLETSPTTQVDEKVIFQTTKNSYMALNGIYRHMYQYLGAHDQAGHMSVMHVMDLMGEDFFPIQRGYGWYVDAYNYTASTNFQSARVEYVWSFYYDIVNNANKMIKFVPDAVGSSTEKNHLMGQAFALRAFGFFMNAQIFSKPYLHTDINAENSGIPIYTEPTSVGKKRETLAVTYQQIVADLDSAIVRLSAPGVPGGPISYINVHVARGLRARVALVMGDYVVAEQMANAALANYPLMSQEEYIGKQVNGEESNGGAFTVANGEWMWGSFNNSEQSTIFASWLSHVDPTTFGYAQLGNMKIIHRNLYNQMSNTDVRKMSFCDANGVWAHDPSGYWDWNPYMSYKFRHATSGWEQTYLYMRAAEMYLIKAEAIARQGGRDAAAAQALYDLVSERDDNYTLSTSTGATLINEILTQRRIELIGEGFRFLDIKRLNLPLVRPSGNPALGFHDAGLATVTNIPAGDYRFQFLIPKSEIDSNPLMVQNALE